MFNEFSNRLGPRRSLDESTTEAEVRKGTKKYDEHSRNILLKT